MACGVHWLPVACFVMLPGTFIISYTIAVVLGHVEPGFPYISDTGAIPPESCIFAQLLNCTAVVVGATIYVRYRMVREHCVNHPRLQKANIAAFVLGLSAAFGVSMVGNFQETNVLVVHLIGAILAFGVGTIYCWVTTVISYKLPGLSSRLVSHIRLFISSFTSLAFIITFAFAAIGLQKFDGDDPKKWLPDQGGWSEHLVSTISEWAMAISMLMYFLTFVGEFKRLHIGEPPCIVLMLDPVIVPKEENYGTFTPTVSESPHVQS